MNKLLFGIGAVILVGVLGYGIQQNKDMMPRDGDKAAMMQKENDTMAMKEKEAMMAKENMTPEQMEMMKKEEAMKTGEVMKKDTEVMEKDAMMKKSAGMYVSYSLDKLALAKDNKVIIFFHAGWCPTCRALEAEVTSKGVKDGYVILKADYDSSKELKAKYGVSTQHTFVQVNTTGAALVKWTGGDLAGIYAKAK